MAQDLESVLSAAHEDAESIFASLGDLADEREAAHGAAALMVGAAEDAAGRAEALAEHEARLLMDRARCEADADHAENMITLTRLVIYAEQIVADALGRAERAATEADAELASRWEGSDHAVAAKELLTASLLEIATHQAESIRAESLQMQRAAKQAIERIQNAAKAECEALEEERRRWPREIQSAAHQLVGDMADRLNRINDHLAGVDSPLANADLS